VRLLLAAGSSGKGTLQHEPDRTPCTIPLREIRGRAVLKSQLGRRIPGCRIVPEMRRHRPVPDSLDIDSKIILVIVHQL
jgi:hypothetical protein